MPRKKKTPTTTSPKTTSPKKTRTTIDDEPDAEALEALKAGDVPPVDEAPGVGQGVEASGGPETHQEGSPVARKKRGRPRKQEPPPDIIPRAVMKALVKAPYMFAAHRFGGHWELTDSEAESLVDSHAELAREYMPSWMQDRPALYVCLFQHTMLIIGRVDIQRRLAALEVEATPADEDETSPNAGLPRRGNESGSDLPRETRHGKIFPDASPSSSS